MNIYDIKKYVAQYPKHGILGEDFYFPIIIKIVIELTNLLKYPKTSE